MKMIKTKLKHSLFLSSDNGEPIVVQQPEISFNGETCFLQGSIAFSVFEQVVDLEMLNFDLETTRPLKDGNMMLVNKDVLIQCVFLPELSAAFFQPKETPNSLIKIFETESSAGTALVHERNWLVLKLYQVQNSKEVGYNSLMNTVDLNIPNLADKWDSMFQNAFSIFLKEKGTSLEEYQDKRFAAKNDDISDEMIEQAKSDILRLFKDEEHPIGKMLNEMFDSQEELEEALEDAPFPFFNPDDDEDEENEDHERQIEEVNQAIRAFLDNEEEEYTYDEAEDLFLVYFETEEGQPFNTILGVSDSGFELFCETVLIDKIPQKKWNKLYRFLNAINAEITFGKIILREDANLLSFRTETPILDDVHIVETLVEGFLFENRIFFENNVNIISRLLDGSIHYEKALNEFISGL
jgi:hypothetical protein